MKTPTDKIPSLWKQPPGPVRGRGRAAESLGDLHATVGEAGGTRMRQKAREVSLWQPGAPASSRHAAQPELPGAGRSRRQCLLEELSTSRTFRPWIEVFHVSRHHTSIHLHFGHNMCPKSYRDCVVAGRHFHAATLAQVGSVQKFCLGRGSGVETHRQGPVFCGSMLHETQKSLRTVSMAVRIRSRLLVVAL